MWYQFLSAPLKTLEKRKVEKLITPPAFRGNFQQPPAPLIESATVPISTHHAIKGHPAFHTRNLYERVAPGIADDEAYGGPAIDGEGRHTLAMRRVHSG